MSKTRIIVLLIVICTCLSRCGSMMKGKKVEKHSTQSEYMKIQEKESEIMNDED